MKTAEYVALTIIAVAIAGGLFLATTTLDHDLGADVSTFRTPTAATVSVGPDSSVTVVAANPARQYLVISAQGSALWLTYGSGTATLGTGELLNASSTKVFTYPNIYTGAITARAYSSSTIATVEQ